MNKLFVLAIALVSVGVLVGMAVLQTPPTSDSYRMAEQLSGGIAYTDVWPNTATMTTAKAGNLTGISLYLKRPPSDVLYVSFGLNYYATCNGTTAGSGYATVQVDNGGWKWFTLPFGNGKVVDSGKVCSIFVSRGGSQSYALWWSVAGPNSPNPGLKTAVLWGRAPPAPGAPPQTPPTTPPPTEPITGTETPPGETGGTDSTFLLVAVALVVGGFALILIRR